MELASGAGHDSAVFTEFGVPSAMIFIRNAHGSHNPEEAMELADFAVGRHAAAGELPRRGQAMMATDILVIGGGIAGTQRSL